MTLYKYEHQLRRLEDRISDASYSQVDKDIIFEYENHLIERGLGLSRVVKYLTQLNIIAGSDLKNGLTNATKYDLVRFVNTIEVSNRSMNTKNEYKRCLSLFYRWMIGDENSSLVNWIEIGRFMEPRVGKEDLITEKDVVSMIDAAGNLRDEAMSAMLYDSGLRIGEFVELKIGDITFVEHGAILSVNGQNGNHQIELVFSVPYLKAWLDVHPHKDEDGAYLWVGLGPHNQGNPMTYDAFNKGLKRLAEKACVRKNVSPRFIRLSRIIELSDQLSAVQMKPYFDLAGEKGLSPAYCHLVSSDPGDALLAVCS